jgi:hypothetical protein
MLVASSGQIRWLNIKKMFHLAVIRDYPAMIWLFYLFSNGFLNPFKKSSWLPFNIASLYISDRYMGCRVVK